MSIARKQSGRERSASSAKRSHACAAELITFEQRTPHPPIRSARAATVARFFGIEQHLPSAATTVAPLSATDRCDLRRGEVRDLLPRAGEIVLLTGPSGAGKSTLLRALREAAARHRLRWSELDDLDLPEVPVVDCLGEHVEVQRVLELLSRVGLAEAWTYLRTPAELSEGQRWRLRLAMCLAGSVDSAAGEAESRKSGNFVGFQRTEDLRLRANSGAAKRAGRSILACDEFAALLDRITACVVARSLRKTIDALARDCPSGSKRDRGAPAAFGASASLGASGAPGVIVATSHDDLIRALAPDVVVQCDFSRVNVMRLHRWELR